MGLIYSDFRRDYYNQVCRRLDRQHNTTRNSPLLYRSESQTNYNFYKRPYFRDQPSSYPYGTFYSEINEETLCMETLLNKERPLSGHATRSNRCYTLPKLNTLF